MLEKYTTILEDVEGGIVEKRSRFIANVFHVETEEEAKIKLNEIKKKYFDAKHHVYAYRIFGGTVIEKFSDDGEPAQTAGKPIIDLIKKKDIYNILIVVTRYFGGILLGTGGLTRAYTQAANVCIENSTIEEMVYSAIMDLAINYEQLDVIKHYCNSSKLKIFKIEYLDKILIQICVDKNQYDKVKEDINNILAGKVEFKGVYYKYVKK